jgi:hypothetical protein
VDPNPILDFGIDKASVQYTGSDLQRPECILAERDGSLWTADSRGGVMNIEPTYTCFDDALELIVERVREDRGAIETLALVHGIATGDRGDLYAHAWVEDGDHCWDSGQVAGQRVYYAVARAEFYAARRVVGSTRYTVRAGDSITVEIPTRAMISIL